MSARRATVGAVERGPGAVFSHPESPPRQTSSGNLLPGAFKGPRPRGRNSQAPTGTTFPPRPGRRFWAGKIGRGSGFPMAPGNSWWEPLKSVFVKRLDCQWPPDDGAETNRFSRLPCPLPAGPQRGRKVRKKPAQFGYFEGRGWSRQPPVGTAETEGPPSLGPPPGRSPLRQGGVFEVPNHFPGLICTRRSRGGRSWR